jgi:enterochelin esterase-like enzyme
MDDPRMEAAQRRSHVGWGPAARMAAWLTAMLVLCALAGCHRAYGRLRYTTLASQVEARSIPYGVYLPPGWDGRTPLPLVLLLHGAGDDQTSADRKEVVEALDQAITRRELPPFIMVAPRGERSFWVDWSDGTYHMREVLLRELVPAVRAAYPIVEGPSGLHLLGVSMGGGGGFQLWLSAREEVGSATLLSAPILREAETRAFLRRFTSEQVVERVFGAPSASRGIDPYAALVGPADLHGSRLIFGAAERDRGEILPSNRAYHALLTERGVPHRFLVFPGRHAWRSWAHVFPYALCLQLSPACGMAAP